MLSGFNPQEIQDLDDARQAITALLNLVEELREENQALRAEVQDLRDEVNRLKGEQGKPNVKANKGKDSDHSSEEGAAYAQTVAQRQQSKPHPD